MRIPNATLADLHEQDYGVHITLHNEDWNEPDQVQVDDSFVHQTARITTVITPTRMRYIEYAGKFSPWTESIIIATYETRGEGNLLTCEVFDDGKMVYAGGTVSLAENMRGRAT